MLKIRTIAKANNFTLSEIYGSTKYKAPKKVTTEVKISLYSKVLIMDS